MIDVEGRLTSGSVETDLGFMVACAAADTANAMAGEPSWSWDLLNHRNGRRAGRWSAALVTLRPHCVRLRLWAHDAKSSHWLDDFRSIPSH